MKPTYKVSASLVNAYIYLRDNPSERVFNEFKDRLQNIYPDNNFLQRGLDFEEEVFDGKHGKLSELVKDLDKQVFAGKTLDFNDFMVRISGKLDVIDKTKKRIYDIKRVSKVSNTKYDTSVQHLFYFYIMPEMEDFYYLVVAGDDVLKEKVLYYKRPAEKDLEELVVSAIEEFFSFLKKENLWETYTQNNQYKGAKYAK
jgi:hypothetical protein